MLKGSDNMPMISSFYGIIIKMYFGKSEHNPPHIHAEYGEYAGVIDIRTYNVIDGNLPHRAVNLIVEWVKMHSDELLKMWDTQNFTKLPPLE